MKFRSLALPGATAAQLLDLVLANLDTWALKSAASFRRTVCGDGGLIINPLINTSDEAPDLIHGMLRDIIEAGRMIDFGTVPNEVMKATAVASREIFEAGELLQPFDEWLGVMSWEGGCNAYHVLTGIDDMPNQISVTELYGVDVPGVGPVLLLYDMVRMIVSPGQTLLDPVQFNNYPASMDPITFDLSRKARGSNSLDPLVTMLRLLADASVPVERVETPEKVNRGRARAGKSPLPPHTVVRTKDYVTRCLAHAAGKRRGEALGGHHASPIAHWRRAHQRHLPGRVVPVRSSRVNWRDAKELHRLFYKVKQEQRP